MPNESWYISLKGQRRERGELLRSQQRELLQIRHKPRDSSRRDDSTFGAVPQSTSNSSGPIFGAAAVPSSRSTLGLYNKGPQAPRDQSLEPRQLQISLGLHHKILRLSVQQGLLQHCTFLGHTCKDMFRRPFFFDFGTQAASKSMLKSFPLSTSVFARFLNRLSQVLKPQENPKMP